MGSGNSSLINCSETFKFLFKCNQQQVDWGLYVYSGIHLNAKHLSILESNTDCNQQVDWGLYTVVFIKMLFAKSLQNILKSNAHCNQRVDWDCVVFI